MNFTYTNINSIKVYLLYDDQISVVRKSLSKYIVHLDSLLCLKKILVSLHGDQRKCTV